jgi:hypothetical protein
LEEKMNKEMREQDKRVRNRRPDSSRRQVLYNYPGEQKRSSEFIFSFMGAKDIQIV